jgi:MFS-type transporter involved in bile tolerance (Atg22 family)
VVGRFAARRHKTGMNWSATDWALVLVIGAPYVAFAIMYLAMVVVNRASTAEIKWILPPSVAFRSIAVVMIVQAILILAVQKLLDASAVAGLIGGIAAGTIGMKTPPQE